MQCFNPDRVLWDIEHILPFTNPVVAGRAEPYVLSNSYFGRETGYRYGNGRAELAHRVLAVVLKGACKLCFRAYAYL